MAKPVSEGHRHTAVYLHSQHPLPNSIPGEKIGNYRIDGVRCCTGL